MLELRGVCKRLGGFALADVSLTVGVGECHVVLGPTGCGKTTLIETILGLHVLDAGEIRLAGRDITALAVGRRGISYVPQDLALFPHLSVRDNIRYPLRVRQAGMNAADKAAAEALADELIDAVQIRPLLRRSVKRLSGGERQRVALVRALVAGGRCVMLDEPLAALHEGLKRELWFVLRDLQRRFDLTLLLITHDLAEAFFLGDTVTVMIDGKIVQTGPKSAVYDRPATLDVARFFGIRNLVPAIPRTSPLPPSTIFDCPTLNAALAVASERCTMPTTPAAAPSATARPGMWIGIRADDVTLAPAAPSAASASDPNRLVGTVRSAIDFGPGVLVSMQPDDAAADDAVIFAVVPRSLAPTLTLGSPVVALLPPNRAFAVSDSFVPAPIM